jgi:4'-phosphopantetheinyl transferase
LKEVYVKSIGQGLSAPLITFSFNIGRSDVIKSNFQIKLKVEQEGQGNPGENWFSCLYYPDDTHCVAVCVNSGFTQHSYKLSVFEGVALEGLELIHRF